MVFASFLIMTAAEATYMFGHIAAAVVILLFLPTAVVTKEENVLWNGKKQQLDNSLPLKIVTQLPPPPPVAATATQKDEDVSCLRNISKPPNRGDEYMILQALFSLDMLILFFATTCGELCSRRFSGKKSNITTAAALPPPKKRKRDNCRKLADKQNQGLGVVTINGVINLRNDCATKTNGALEESRQSRHNSSALEKVFNARDQSTDSNVGVEIFEETEEIECSLVISEAGFYASGIEAEHVGYSGGGHDEDGSKPHETPAAEDEDEDEDEGVAPRRCAAEVRNSEGLWAVGTESVTSA
ncbi:hypothetical protein LguiB_013760 [Lonicera macranthoides]